MHNFTDRLAVHMNRAFNKSKMSVEDFIMYLEETRENLITFTITDTSASFVAYIDYCPKNEGTYEFSFVDGQWHCKG